MNPYNLLKSVIKVELFLSITLFLLPILLPLVSGELLSSVSLYAHSKAWWLYNLILITVSLCLIIDGIKDENRRFNIILGISMLGVVIFTVEGNRYIHNFFAILFFLENLTILTYYTKVLTRRIKIVIFSIVTITLTLFLLHVISLFFAEAIGLFCVSAFFFIRFKKIY